MYFSSSVSSANKPMMVSLFISLLAFIKGEAAACDDGSANVRGRCYEKEVLLDYLSRPGMLVVDFHTNVLYFSNKTSFYTYPVPRYLDLTTRAVGAVTRVGNINSQTVDQVGHQVYIAGTKGIYKFYYHSKTAERLVADASDVYTMIYNDDLYFTDGLGDAYTLKDGEIIEIEEMKDYDAEFLAVDKDGYIFFRNTSGLFGKTKGSSSVDIIRNTKFYGNVATDVTGIPYACEAGHLHFVNKEEKTLEAIGDLKGCTDLAFDKDNNVIYSTWNEIIRLNSNDAY